MNKSKIFKSVITLTLLLCMLVTLSVSSFATTFSRTYSGSFADDWMASADTMVEGAQVILSYGFNTFLINEDVAYSLHYGYYHQSKIKNANGIFFGPLRQAHEWSDLEVTHSGTTITYYSQW